VHGSTGKNDHLHPSSLIGPVKIEKVKVISISKKRQYYESRRTFQGGDEFSGS
jgi:hypothetical protein